MKKTLYDLYDYFLILIYFYVKPFFIFIGLGSTFTYLNSFFLNLVFILNLVNINLNLIITKFLMQVLPFFLLKTLSITSMFFTFKFVLLISLFIFARGGIPRYRYDFLTKVGWIKMLSLLLYTFLTLLIFLYLF